MKTRIITIALIALAFIPLFAQPVRVASAAELTYTTNRKTPIQAAVRKKAWQQAPFALSSASKVIRLQGTVQAGEIDMTGALGVIVRPSSSNLNAWYDSDTTKTWTLDGGDEASIVADPAASTITINGTDTSIEVGGF